MRSQSATVRSLYFGIAFGMLFPIGATALDLWLRGGGWSFAGIVAVQATQPLHWMIDTAPLFLGLFAAVAGRRQDRLEQLNGALVEQRGALEQALRAAERADTLARLSAENAALYEQTRRQLDAMEKLEQVQARDARIMRALALPMISVRREVLVLPLIGMFDAERTVLLRDSVLRHVERSRARVISLDCTGVEAFLRDALRPLEETIDALALLGTRAVLTGISPELAEVLIASDLRPNAFQTAADLENGLALAQRLLGRLSA
jgi:anti-anti-sigma regulatory factor